MLTHSVYARMNYVVNQINYLDRLFRQKNDNNYTVLVAENKEIPLMYCTLRRLTKIIIILQCKVIENCSFNTNCWTYSLDTYFLFAIISLCEYKDLQTLYTVNSICTSTFTVMCVFRFFATRIENNYTIDIVINNGNELLHFILGLWYVIIIPFTC